MQLKAVVEKYGFEGILGIDSKDELFKDPRVREFLSPVFWEYVVMIEEQIQSESRQIDQLEDEKVRLVARDDFDDQIRLLIQRLKPYFSLLYS